ncbi:hypothetical protein DSM106972_081160 [Dulcicalothrix desertica PCC 7102]|uniref:Uncharacterized protein n=1 Tax=Dulcicalothrix desertica PCC 7102 TaxID=232991 RepID=A0A433UXH1_9CYAN|nr:hypothetical protein DSM106972_081160 [Dulcicalothrix desertica PCC 7102]TWH49741.1 hypothetical protein CAL7102_03965 [Dulcicalothrix desertica PCC 7102]
MNRNQRPSNIFIKVIVAILLLFGCYLIGTFIFNAVRRNNDDYKESRKFNVHCSNNNYDLICVASKNVYSANILRMQDINSIFFHSI